MNAIKHNFLGVIILLLIGGFFGWSISTPKTVVQAQNQKTYTQKEVDLTMNMRKLWEDHITWTRMYIVSSVAEGQDKDVIAQRLLKNQEDIGNAIKPYYGNSAGDRLTTLLKEHITTAVEVVDAAKIGDQDTLNDANKRWYDNGNRVSDFLSSANPNNWKRDETRAMLKQHLDSTGKEAADIINGNFAESVIDYDVIHSQILGMSDILSIGLVRQFPAKFGK